MSALRLKNFLYNRKSFWTLKTWLKSHVFFRIYRRIFKIILYVQESVTRSLIFKNSILDLLRYLFGAIVIIASLEGIGILLKQTISLSVNQNIANTILTTIASVGGVFIALYFAAISVSAGTLFAQAPDSLREIFRKNRAGNQYIEIICITIIVSIFYLILQSTGYPIHPITITSISLFAFYGVVRFISLGFQSFYFLHPIETLNELVNNLYKAIERSEVKGHQSNNPDFQNHYSEQASNTLETLEQYFDFGKNNLKFSADNHHIFTRYIGGVMEKYIKEKNKIPKTSLWFKKKQKFQSWFLADSSEIIISLNADVPIRAQEIPDFDWFEDYCGKLFVLPYKHFANTKNWDFLQSGSLIATKLLEDFANELDYKNSNNFVEKIDGVLESTLKNDRIPDIDLIRIADIQGMLPISMLIGCRKLLDNTDSKSLDKKIKSIDWLNRESVYLSGFPFQIMPELDDISERLHNESLVEGRVKTEFWYINTLVYRKYTDVLKEYLDYVLNINKDYYHEKIERAKKSNKHLVAIQLIHRWLEFLNKFTALTHIAKQRVTELNSRHLLKDLPWPEIDLAKINEAINIWRKKAIISAAELLNDLPDFSDKQNLPDYFGHVYTFGTDLCHRACNKNDKETYKALFPEIFNAGLRASDLVRKQTVGWLQQSQIIYSTEPLVDLLELSGYSYIYSELYQDKALWNICKLVWDTYLNSHKNTKEVIQYLASTVEYRESLFLMMPRATLRSNYELDLKRKLAEKGLVHDRTTTFIIEREEKPKHPSKIINLISDHNAMLHTAPISVFIAIYLSRRAEAKDIVFPDRRDLIKRLNEDNS